MCLGSPGSCGTGAAEVRPSLCKRGGSCMQIGPVLPSWRRLELSPPTHATGLTDPLDLDGCVGTLASDDHSEGSLATFSSLSGSLLPERDDCAGTLYDETSVWSPGDRSGSQDALQQRARRPAAATFGALHHELRQQSPSAPPRGGGRPSRCLAAALIAGGTEHSGRLPDAVPAPQTPPRRQKRRTADGPRAWQVPDSGGAADLDLVAGLELNQAAAPATPSWPTSAAVASAPCSSDVQRGHRGGCTDGERCALSPPSQARLGRAWWEAPLERDDWGSAAGGPRERDGTPNAHRPLGAARADGDTRLQAGMSPPQLPSSSALTQCTVPCMPLHAASPTPWSAALADFADRRLPHDAGPSLSLPSLSQPPAPDAVPAPSLALVAGAEPAAPRCVAGEEAACGEAAASAPPPQGSHATTQRDGQEACLGVTAPPCAFWRPAAAAAAAAASGAGPLPRRYSQEDHGVGAAFRRASSSDSTGGGCCRRGEGLAGGGSGSGGSSTVSRACGTDSGPLEGAMICGGPSASSAEAASCRPASTVSAGVLPLRGLGTSSPSAGAAMGPRAPAWHSRRHDPWDTTSTPATAPPSGAAAVAPRRTPSPPPPHQAIGGAGRPGFGAIGAAAGTTLGSPESGGLVAEAAALRQENALLRRQLLEAQRSPRDAQVQWPAASVQLPRQQTPLPRTPSPPPPPPPPLVQPRWRGGGDDAGAPSPGHECGLGSSSSHSFAPRAGAAVARVPQSTPPALATTAGLGAAEEWSGGGSSSSRCRASSAERVSRTRSTSPSAAGGSSLCGGACSGGASIATASCSGSSGARVLGGASSGRSTSAASCSSGVRRTASCSRRGSSSDRCVCGSGAVGATVSAGGAYPVPGAAVAGASAPGARGAGLAPEAPPPAPLMERSTSLRRLARASSQPTWHDKRSMPPGWVLAPTMQPTSGRRSAASTAAPRGGAKLRRRSSAAPSGPFSTAGVPLGPISSERGGGAGGGLRGCSLCR